MPQLSRSRKKYLKNFISEEKKRGARQEEASLHKYFQEKAAQLRPAESGLLALDWWNGNRSVLSDDELSGLLLGLTLQTKPEEVYLALLEAVTFGAKVILDAYQRGGIKINEIVAAGGMSWKNDLLMQIYADVMKIPIYIAESPECAAKGSSIFAAVAAGEYRSISDAAHAMGRRGERVFRADPARARIYDRLFLEYRKLYDYFGRGGNTVMKELKRLKKEL